MKKRVNKAKNSLFVLLGFLLLSVVLLITVYYVTNYRSSTESRADNSSGATYKPLKLDYLKVCGTGRILRYSDSSCKAVLEGNFTFSYKITNLTSVSQIAMVKAGTLVNTYAFSVIDQPTIQAKGIYETTRTRYLKLCGDLQYCLQVFPSDSRCKTFISMNAIPYNQVASCR